MSSREQVQIPDLEPSTPEEPAVYIIQLRGVDSRGNAGPWSEGLEFVAPEITVDKSNDYEPGQDGWIIDHDGPAEFNNVVIRGDLSSVNYIPGTLGWSLSRLGDFELNTGEFRGQIVGGSIQIGGANAFNVDTIGNIWTGAPTFNNAEFTFRVSAQGALTAANATITGGSFSVGAGASKFRVDSSGNMWLGADNLSLAPFRVTNTGALTTNNATVTGGSFTVGSGNNVFRVDTAGRMWLGDTDFNSAPFSVTSNGQLKAESGTFAGTLSSAGGSFTGNHNGGSISGTSIVNGSGNSALRVDSLGNMWLGNTSFDNAPFRVDRNGNLRANAGTFSGSLSGAEGTFSGSLTASITEANQVRATQFIGRTNANLSLVAQTGRSLGITAGTTINIAASSALNLSGTSISISALTGGITITGILRVANADGVGVGSTTDTVRYSRTNNDAVISMGNGSVQGATGVATLRLIKMNTTSVTGANMVWNSTVGRVFAPGSSRKIKKDITPAGKMPGLLDATAVTYYPKHYIEIEGGSIEDLDKNSEEYLDYIKNYQRKQIGFIAEDLHDAGLGIFVVYNNDDEPSAVDYAKIGVALLPYVKELYDKIEQLEEKLNGS